jgi:hypothetical protein
MHSETDAPRIIAFMRLVRSQPTETMRGAQGQLLERGRDACERRIEAGPDARNDGYDGNGNAGGYETILNGGRSGFVSQETSDQRAHFTRSLLIGVTLTSV